VEESFAFFMERRSSEDIRPVCLYFGLRKRRILQRGGGRRCAGCWFGCWGKRREDMAVVVHGFFECAERSYSVFQMLIFEQAERRHRSVHL
jgi:hypothetical protein